MITFKIYDGDYCRANLIKKNKNGVEEFSNINGSYKLKMSKNLKAYLQEFKADPLRYNYDEYTINQIMNGIVKCIKQIQCHINIYLLPQMFSIVSAIDIEEAEHQHGIVIFPSITPKKDFPLWLMCHEVGHSVQREIIGINEYKNEIPVWEQRTHEKFANLFAKILIDKLEGNKK